MHRRVYERPAEWNELRYKRVYNPTLYTDMLLEEYEEFESAKTLVDKLDGLSDIFFISVGALWKLREDPYKFIYRNYKEVLDYPK